MLTWLRDAGGTIVPRTIGPLFDSMLWRLESSAANSGKRTVALTFDDGPTESGTPALLEVLAEFNVPATHFVLGEQVTRFPTMAEAMISAGHEVGNHSWSHLDGWKAAMPSLIRDYRQTDALLRAMTGRDVRFVRPPYGKFTYPLIHWARRRGQRVVLWDTMPADYSTRATVSRVTRTIQMIRPRSIVCLHDNERSRHVTPAALRRTLPKLLDAGWNFVPLTETPSK